MIIGLTGGIGSGKTLASEYLRLHHGFDILDNDVTARDIVALGSPILMQISRHFGAKSLMPDGTLDRAYLREQIFSNPTEKLWLESITHPEIRRLTLERIAATAQNSVLIPVSPLLFESQQDSLCDQTVVIRVPRELQIARVKQRDANTDIQVKRIMKNQLSDDNRTERADHIVYNDGTIEHLYQQLDHLAQSWKKS